MRLDVELPAAILKGMDVLIFKVQAELAFISNPKITTKLLQKPPFRFIHDIASAVRQTTHFLDGTFSDLENDAHSIDSKDAKIAYLQKLISAVESANGGKKLDVKPTKIVAGSDVENTLRLLLVRTR